MAPGSTLTNFKQLLPFRVATSRLREGPRASLVGKQEPFPNLLV